MRKRLQFDKGALFLAAMFVFGNCLFSQNKELPKPHLSHVPYGSHERNVLDIWFADSNKISPLAIYIHGGGFVSGRKEKLNPILLEELLAEGISVAAINYRFLSHATLPAAHQDALRALQFIRSKAEKWKIDKKRIGAFGSSAGAQLCMWLAFSDEMANPNAEDAVERESSRLTCVSTTGGQTTMDSVLLQKWIPEFVKYGTSQDQFYGKLAEVERKKLIESISAISIVSTDDPPIFMKYGIRPGEAIPSNPKRAAGWKIHHVIFGIKLKEKMDQLGVAAYLKYPGVETKYSSHVDFLSYYLLKE